MFAVAASTNWLAAGQHAPIGREVAVPAHLQDGQEFTVPLPALLAHGQLLFKANWTEQEGGGRPLTKGTGRPLADPSQPLTGARAFNRVSAPDAELLRGLPQRAVRHRRRRRRLRRPTSSCSASASTS